MTVKQIQNLLQYLGYYAGIPDGISGQLTRQAVERFQEDFGGIAVDGVPGRETQKALTRAVAHGIQSQKADTGTNADWWQEIEYFTPPEVACQCGKYCDGYPYEMQPLTMQIVDRARKHFGKPIIIVSGLRCEQHNAAVGGVANSQHMFGEALDVNVPGESQQTVLSWFQSQPDVRYAYAISGSNNVHFDIQKVGR